MNALTVLSIAALAACSSSQLLGYPGPLGYGGGVLLPRQSPVTLKTIAASPITYNTVAASPLAYNVAPIAQVAQVAPVAPVQTQYHAQDELGQYSFGFAGGPSSRAEHRDAFGVVRGSYNYVDSEGKVQTQHYVADALGFRVSGTNLPVAPEAPVAAPLALPGPLPEPVQDTPEVAAAKLAHQEALDKAAAAAVDAVATRKKRSIFAAPALSTYSAPGFSYGFSAPVVGSGLQYTAGIIPSAIGYSHHAPALAYAAHGAVAPALTPYATTAAIPAAVPAVVPAATAYSAAAATPRDGTLLRVVNNPSHAVSYRVD